MSDDATNTVTVDPVRALNQAIDAGYGNRFEQRLAEVPDLNARDDSGWPPLKRAMHAGSAPFVERLLKAGADPNAVPVGDESSALAVAVNINRPDLVELLLRHGAVPRTLRPRDLQPLSTACVLKSTEMVRMLLDAGAAVDGDGGDSTLISTARAVAPDVAELLLARGADVNRVDREGWSALSWAAWASPWGCMPARVVRVDPSEKLSPAELAKRFEDPPPPTPEQLQAHEAKIVRLVGLLLDHGADPNLRDKSGRPPLAHVKCASVARLLIERGARTDLRDRRKQGVYDWLAASRISPADVGLGPRPPEASSPPAAEAQAPKRKGRARK